LIPTAIVAGLVTGLLARNWLWTLLVGALWALVLLVDSREPWTIASGFLLGTVNGAVGFAVPWAIRRLRASRREQ